MIRPYTDHYCTLSAVVLVEGNHVLEGEVTYDITVENKEGIVVFKKNILCQSQGTSYKRTGCSLFITYLLPTPTSVSVESN